jgi:hypothetical protein
MSARITDLTLVDAWERLRRYRPLLLTVVLTLGTLRLAPDGAGPQLTGLATAPGPPTTQPVGAVRDASPPSPTQTSNPPTTRLPRLTPAPAGAPPVVTTPARSAPLATAPAARTPEPVSGAPSAPPIVRYTAWASTEAGTPIAGLGVPAQALPVSNRLGQLTKASFVRTEGEWSRLVLDVDAEGTTPAPELSLRACAITTAEWQPGAEQRFEDAPEWDDRCTDGVSEGDKWSFRLEQIDHRFGVAIVPGPEAPLDFQISFRDPRPQEATS